MGNAKRWEGPARPVLPSGVCSRSPDLSGAPTPVRSLGLEPCSSHPKSPSGIPVGAQGAWLLLVSWSGERGAVGGLMGAHESLCPPAGMARGGLGEPGSSSPTEMVNSTWNYPV